jgi:hypothetical protein
MESSIHPQQALTMLPGQPDVQEHNCCQFQTFGSIR